MAGLPPFASASVASGPARPVPRPHGVAYLPPPLPRRDARRDGLTPAQRHVVLGAILTAHVAAAWGLLQIREVREAVAEAARLIARLIAPAEPLRPVPVVPPPLPQAVPKRPPPVVIAAAPSPAPASFSVPTPPPEIAPPPVELPTAVAAPAPPAPPPPAPKIIPASAVQYLEPIVIEYPRVSKRLGESGRVLIRLFIDEAGLARTLQINRSSGHARLDDAALAAVRKARFKPYTENGQPLGVWTFIPVEYELEK
ncbi:MAG: energy transducer TonB [Caldimonas sp.]